MFPTSDFKAFDNFQVVSNYKTGGGFWHQGYAMGTFEVEAMSAYENYHRGDLSYKCSPELIEIYEWCQDIFGEEWERWHLRPLATTGLYKNSTEGLFSRQTSDGSLIKIRKIPVEMYVVYKQDLALFKLRWAT